MHFAWLLHMLTADSYDTLVCSVQLVGSFENC